MRETGQEAICFLGQQGKPGKKPHRKRRRSLRRALYYWIPICSILAFLGTMVIGVSTNYAQDWYMSNYMKEQSIRIWHGEDGRYEIYVAPNSTPHYNYVVRPVSNGWDAPPLERIIYDLISASQCILIPLWILACLGMAVWIFYKRELEKPIRVLREASEKIADNCLDFEMEAVRDNELGQLRDGFEKMRAALYENNRVTWQMLEERKRLNAAFAHDMRTPITVLKGYGEMLERYVPEGKISQEKLMGILGMMNGQIRRLESYTQKMSSIRKLEDLEPEPVPMEASVLQEKLRGMCEILGGDISYSFGGVGTLYLDEALVLEVCENLVSNGLRYTRQMLRVTVQMAEGGLSSREEKEHTCEEKKHTSEGEPARYLEVVVEDDGPGFGPEELQHATDPFYRGEGQMEQCHFGLGLYICRLICAKCGGSLALSNSACGGRVAARFQIYPEIQKSR